MVVLLPQGREGSESSVLKTLVLILRSLDDACLLDGHFSFPNASASEHDGRSRQQHYGPGACTEPVPATEPVPVLQWGDERKQCGHGAAGGPDRRATGTAHPGRGPSFLLIRIPEYTSHYYT